MLVKTGYGLSGGQKTAGGGGGGASNYMQDVIASACLDVDATIEGSYDGSSQTLANLIPSPADGAAQTDYDFWLGADGSIDASLDPVFTGTAGSDTAYFACDGTQEMRMKTFTGPTIDNWIITTASHPAWVAWAGRTPPTFFNNDYFWGNAATANAQYGVTLGAMSAGNLRMGHHTATQNLTDFTTTLSTSTDYIIILSWDASTGTVRVWTETLSETPTVSFTANSTNCTDDFTILARGGNADLTTGSRFYAMSAGNELLPADGVKAQAIIDEYIARHDSGRVYK